MYSPLSLIKLSANNVLKLCKSRSLEYNTTIIDEINNLNIPDDIKIIVKNRYYFYKQLNQ
jgi:hypothetical protein